MKITKKNNIHDNIFFVCYFMLLFSVIFDRVIFLNEFLKYFEYIPVLILFLSYITDLKFYKKKFFKFIVISFFIIISTIITKNLVLLKLVLLLLGSKSIDFNKIVKFDCCIRSIFVICVVILHYMGMTNDYLTLRDNILRNSMGFSHPNIFALNILIINMGMLYLSKDKFKLINLLLNLISIVIINNYTYSRTSLYILVFIMIGYYVNLLFKLEIKNKIIKIIVKNSFLIFTLLTFICLVLYNNNLEIGLKIDNFLSTRIYCISKILSEYHVNLLGNYIPFISTELAKKQLITPIVLDNAYFHLLIRYGIIVYLIFYFMFRTILNDMISKNNVFGIIIIIAFLIYGISETFMFNISYNIFLFYFSGIIFPKIGGQNE